MRNQIKIALTTPLFSILFFFSNGSAAFAESGNEKLDSYYVKQFERFNEAFEIHIRQLDKCIAEMEIFERKDTELVFNDAECSKFEKLQPEVQDLFKEVTAVLGEYYQWINSLTENTFKELVKYSNSSKSMLFASTRKYLTKQKKALDQSERVMQKQVRRLSEMEQMIKQAEQKIESSREDNDSQVRGKSN